MIVRSHSTGLGKERRGNFDPQAHVELSTIYASPTQPAVCMCKPLWASHSDARSSPRIPIICSNTGTLNDRHRWSRSFAVSRISPGRASAITARLNDGNAVGSRLSNCARVAAIAAGTNCAASLWLTKKRTGSLSRNRNGEVPNQSTSSAVRGAFPTGYRNVEFLENQRDFEENTKL